MMLKSFAVVCFVVVVSKVDKTFALFADKDLDVDFSDILEKLFHHDKKVVVDKPDYDIKDKELESKELLKLLPLLLGKDKVIDSLDDKFHLGDHDHGIDLDSHDLLKSSDHSKILLLLLKKAALLGLLDHDHDFDKFGLGDHDHGIDLDSHDLLKSSEYSTMLLLLLKKAKLLGLLDHDHDFHKFDLDGIDLDSHDLLKSSEFTKMLPILLTKAKLLGLLDHDHDFGKIDLGDHDLLKTSELSKILPILLIKAKLLGLLDHDHDLFHMDHKLGFDDHLDILLPLLLLKAKLGHDLIDIGHVIGDHAAGSAALAKILPLLLVKGKVDASIGVGDGILKSLDHQHDHHDLFDFDDSIWVLLKGMKAAEVATILPVLLGKEKCELLGLDKGFDLDDNIWDLCKGLESAELAKILPLLLAKGKLIGSALDKGGKDLGPLMQAGQKVVGPIVAKGGEHLGPLIQALMAKKGMVPDKPVEHDRDYFLDQLKYHGVNIQADDCYNCYYDDSGFYYTLQR